MYLVGSLTEIPDNYKGEETVVFYVNPFTSRLVVLSGEDGGTPESVKRFQKLNGGRYLGEFEGVNREFIKKANQFADKQPQDPDLKKVNINDIV